MRRGQRTQYVLLLAVLACSALIGLLQSPYAPRFAAYYHYRMCLLRIGYDEFCAHQRPLRELALAGDPQGLDYLLAVTVATDGMMGVEQGGALADVLIAVGDETFAKAAAHQTPQCQDFIFRTMPGDFTKGSVDFQWERFPVTFAQIKPYYDQGSAGRLEQRLPANKS